MINIIDYGSGNIRSVVKALEHLGVPARISTDPRDIASADRNILPGVGAFGACVEGVRRGGFESAIRDFIASGRPLLGICVGMQILVETSEESPDSPGLGILHGRSPKFSSDLKIPQIGWNRVRRNRHEPRLLRDIPDGAYFYFVHSYFVEPTGTDAGTVAALCDYGQTFPAVLERDNLFATQFHPEKSQAWGLKLLQNFATI